MEAEHVNIPISAIPEAMKSPGYLRDLMFFMGLKAREGRFLGKSYPQKDVFRLVRRGWLVPHRGKLYQRRTIDVFRCVGFSHARMPVACLGDIKRFKAMLFAASCAYLMSPQAQRRKVSKQRSRQVNGSRHNGGVAHSICMSFFGLSKSWCSKMRRECERHGLAAWKRRWCAVQDVWAYADALGRGRYRLRDGVPEEEITSEFLVLDGGVHVHVPYRYRKEVCLVHS